MAVGVEDGPEQVVDGEGDVEVRHVEQVAGDPSTWLRTGSRRAVGWSGSRQEGEDGVWLGDKPQIRWFVVCISTEGAARARAWSSGLWTARGPRLST
jgi:hypothetical protein